MREVYRQFRRQGPTTQFKAIRSSQPKRELTATVRELDARACSESQTAIRVQGHTGQQQGLARVIRHHTFEKSHDSPEPAKPVCVVDPDGYTGFIMVVFKPRRPTQEDPNVVTMVTMPRVIVRYFRCRVSLIRSVGTHQGKGQ